jgi:hypothetical protein
MANLVPLPAVADLPKVVIFHRTDPREPMLVMQVPKAGGSEEFETYRLRLDKADHKRWMSRLPNARDLAYKLTFEPHLAYFPQDGGTAVRLEDVGAPSYIQNAIAQMRNKPDPSKLDAQFRRRRREAPGISRLRMFLTGGKARP